MIIDMRYLVDFFPLMEFPGAFESFPNIHSPEGGGGIFQSFFDGVPTNPKSEEDFGYRTAESESVPDALSAYLRNAEKYPLLSAEDEIRLARAIRAGDESARERMIRSNLRLVASVARDFRNR